jgi:hypothetical protein
MTVVVCCATVGIIVIVNPTVILKTTVIVPINIFVTPWPCLAGLDTPSLYHLRLDNSDLNCPRGVLPLERIG